jgi:23S rRNA pseudouridine2605 synthase
MPTDNAQAKDGGRERIAKRIARAGLCSRREAERWIVAGRVSIDDTIVSDPATNVGAENAIVVDGKPLPSAAPTRLWRYHKPAGLITSHSDPQGRPTVFGKVSGTLGYVISVGRLDFNSEGLLLLTNDGGLARKLEHPSLGWLRRYRARVMGTPRDDALAALAKGVTVDGMRYGPIDAVLDRQSGRNAWLTVSLAEGRNREVRIVLQHLGLTVNRLIRVAYGPFQLGKLARGEIEQVPPRVVRDQLGRKPSGPRANRRR